MRRRGHHAGTNEQGRLAAVKEKSAFTKSRELLLLAAVALLLLLAGISGWLSRVDQAGLDRLLAFHAQSRTLPAEIVLIDIDQKSLENMNDVAGSWPWPRAAHAELIDKLARQKPKAIVFDLLLNEADTFRAESDALFAGIVAGTPGVYLPTMLMSNGIGTRLSEFPPALKIERTATAIPQAQAPLLLPLIVPMESWRGGTINFLADEDGIGRRYALHTNVDGWRIPSMPQRVASDLRWPLPASTDYTLNWYAHIAQRHSYSDVFLDLTGSAPELENVFRDKIVVIGAAAPGLGDLRPTPMGSTYPGVLVLATALGNLHNGDWLTDTRWGMALYPLLLLPLLFAFRRKVGVAAMAITLIGVSLMLAGGEFLLIAGQGIVVHAMGPMAAAWLLFFALALVSWWQERAQREQAVSMFGRFLDPRVVKDLVDGGGVANAQSTQAREISVLFSDIRGFTTLSERSTPEQVVTLLNDYFSRQVQVIFRRHGTLDKFIGDAIMAFWGAPANDPRHAIHAVEAALDMVDELLTFRAGLGEQGEHFDVGIGVHSGPAVVGFIGSQDRLDYTAIGDSVNLSSRIEGATKGVARILVSESTMIACGDAFDFVDHGIVHVKGREQGVRLYEPFRKNTAGSTAAGVHG
jgi:adenylate cyclase